MSRLFCSSCLLLLPFAITVAAPVPLPKPDRQTEQSRFDRLKQELRERGVSVTEVKQVGPKDWIVQFMTSRAPCLVGIRGKLFSSRVEAQDRGGALNVLLQRYREEDEQAVRRLRALGAIP
jgi:hypothetical protein